MADPGVPRDENLAAYWRRVGPLLEEIRRQELGNFKHEENWEIIDALLEMGLQHATPRTTSGLVELERLLAKGHRTKAPE